MSWLRSAVNKAVDVGGNNPITRTVRNYADTVVHHAGQVVVEGTKVFQDRIGSQNFQSFKFTVKRLEEVSVSCTGLERIQLLRRWSVQLKGIDRLPGILLDDNAKVHVQTHISNEAIDSPRKASLALYYDSDLGGEPMNFREVFLHSQALEGIIMSMVSCRNANCFILFFEMHVTNLKKMFYRVLKSETIFIIVFSSCFNLREDLLVFIYLYIYWKLTNNKKGTKIIVEK
ncbi:hypothetical protein GIB67_038203 [Kingdonia uniflora]|uniref:Uncharacterized protein n=1 Tax=Kingdonia uniflora TaxID=39325 RepID=A0A7J7NGZ9_9MAGN|nr:hypothetical protein GIB67_038203 [Kingdonia uniflora]